jgi:type IV pilus assembly protein PilM
MLFSRLPKTYMGWAIPTGRNKRRDQIISIDLGSRSTKAVFLQRRGGGFSLARYAIKEAPGGEKPFDPALLGEHLRSVIQMLEPKTRQVILSLGVNDSVLRTTEMPQIPVSDMRQMLKINTKNHLQQELPNHAFDCYIVAPRADAPRPEAGKGPNKFKVWVGAAPSPVLSDLQAAAKNAGVSADEVALGTLGPVNAFEAAFPEVFRNEVVALVDLGFKNSTISIVAKGDLVLNRMVTLGGDRLTAALAELMNVSYAEAEGIKIGMPQEVETALQPALSSIGRELRASLDFFETQSDQPVSAVYISGGAARSVYFVQALQSDLMVPCQCWNPASFLKMELPPEQAAELEYIAPQLAVAIGAATTLF